VCGVLVVFVKLVVALRASAEEKFGAACEKRVTSRGEGDSFIASRGFRFSGKVHAHAIRKGKAKIVIIQRQISNSSNSTFVMPSDPISIIT
jgi:hypothetical protein